jgi:hypothetical protein
MLKSRDKIERKCNLALSGKFLLDNSIILLKERDRSRGFSNAVYKRNQWNSIFLSFLLFVSIGLRKYVISSISKVNSFISDYMKPLKEEKYSSYKGFFVLIEIQKFLKLYDFLHRDTGMYIPDTYRV